MVPAPPTSRAPQSSRRESENPKDKQMIIISPADDGECGGGHNHGREAPVVDRSESRMMAWSFPAEHCNDASDDSAESNSNVKGDSS
jgi:hypothetical protein